MKTQIKNGIKLMRASLPGALNIQVRSSAIGSDQRKVLFRFLFKLPLISLVIVIDSPRLVLELLLADILG